MDYLKEDLIQLYNYHPDDVRVYIPDIQKKMDKRAILFKNLNEQNNCDENEFYNCNNSLFEEIINS